MGFPLREGAGRRSFRGAACGWEVPAVVGAAVAVSVGAAVAGVGAPAGVPDAATGAALADAPDAVTGAALAGAPDAVTGAALAGAPAAVTGAALGAPAAESANGDCRRLCNRSYIRGAFGPGTLGATGGDAWALVVAATGAGLALAPAFWSAAPFSLYWKDRLSLAARGAAAVGEPTCTVRGGCIASWPVTPVGGSPGTPETFGVSEDAGPRPTPDVGITLLL